MRTGAACHPAGPPVPLTAGSKLLGIQFSCLTGCPAPPLTDVCKEQGTAANYDLALTQPMLDMQAAATCSVWTAASGPGLMCSQQQLTMSARRFPMLFQEMDNSLEFLQRKMS